MIGGVTKFAGRGRDARALAAHLAKPQPGGSTFEPLNSAAPDTSALIAEARALAASRGIADRPFLHVHLSPSSTLDHAQMRRAAEIVCRELGITDQPVGIEFHGKPRTSGEGGLHAHLVIGRASASGALLKSGFEKIRLETACRVAEFEVGDRHVLGRHFRSSVKHLRSIGRDDIADSMIRAHGDQPPKPRGLSPEKRQQLERNGAQPVATRETVKTLWSQSDDAASFATALAERGLSIRPGDKAGVWVVAGSDGEILGAVDRLTGERRKAVAARFAGYDPHDHASRRPRGPSRTEDAYEHRGEPNGPDRADAGEPGGKSGPHVVGGSDEHVREPVPAAGQGRAESSEDRAADGHRRSAVAALTISAASQAVERIAALRDRIAAVLRRDRDSALRIRREEEERQRREILEMAQRQAEQSRHAPTPPRPSAPAPTMRGPGR